MDQICCFLDLSVTLAFVPFSSSGAKPLDLAGKYLAIDWRNYPRQPDFVVVKEKDLVWITLVSSKFESI